MANQWFKFYGGEYLSDQKMGNLTAQERSCLITLLCLASISSIPGQIEFLTTEILLEKSGVHFDPYDTSEWDNCLAVLDKFERLKIIEKKDGLILVVNWEKRQEHILTNAERQAKYRDNKKSNEKVTKRVTKVTLDKNRIEENRIDNTKNTYGEFKNVFLKDEEYKKLTEKMGEQNTKIIIEELSGYIAQNGRDKYKNHYATIQNWARRRVQEHSGKFKRVADINKKNDI